MKIGDRNSGVKIEDLLDSAEFLSRRHEDKDAADRQSRAIERLRTCSFQSSNAALQEVVQIALEFCDADSAGISLEEVNEKGELQFRWIAVAGSFAPYLNGTTPRFYSPCGSCIDRGVALHYQVNHRYYNFLGVNAEPIRDGILIPLRCEDMLGTFWVVSHSTEDAFDRHDYEFLRSIADLVSRSIRDHSQI
jgi:GAF domain-containing protein